MRTQTRTLHNFAGGEWREAAGVEHIDDRDPATGETIARVPLSGAAEVDLAVRAAAAAQREWREISPLERARAVFALRDGLDARREDLARLITADMGKTLDEARGEVARGLESVEVACGAPTLMKGENLEGVAGGVDVEMVRQPVGVVAAITPFNFPVMIPLWFLPFALATGNALLLKPSEQDPLPSELIFEILAGIDAFPAGVANLVHGGRDAVEALLDHPGIDAVSFVGQASTAAIVATRAARNGKRVQALGGAKNALVVMPDADPDVAVPGVIASAFGCAGQRCLAGSVAVLVGSEAERERARRRLLDAAAGLVTGPGGDEATDVCPVVSPAARERVEAAIAQAEAEGARVLLDGRGDGGAGGAELRPTVLEAGDVEAQVTREELFGPVLTLIGVPDLDAAVDWINAGRYGNSALLFTSSGAVARDFRHRVEAGMLGVNVGVAAPVAWFPFAGWKDSFTGDLHANGADAVEFYTRKKIVTSRW